MSAKRSLEEESGGSPSKYVRLDIGTVFYYIIIIIIIIFLRLFGAFVVVFAPFWCFFCCLWWLFAAFVCLLSLKALFNSDVD